MIRIYQFTWLIAVFKYCSKISAYLSLSISFIRKIVREITMAAFCFTKSFFLCSLLFSSLNVRNILLLRRSFKVYLVPVSNVILSLHNLTVGTMSFPSTSSFFDSDLMWTIAVVLYLWQLYLKICFQNEATNTLSPNNLQQALFENHCLLR